MNSNPLHENKHERLTPGALLKNPFAFEDENKNLMSRKTISIVSRDRNFEFYFEFTKLPDLVHNNSKSIVNLKIASQPLSNIKPERVMLKKGSRLIEFIDIRDSNSCGFSIPNEWFADRSLAIHLILSNSDVIIFNDLIFPQGTH